MSAGLAGVRRDGTAGSLARRRGALALFYLTILALGIAVRFFQLPPPEGGVALDRALFQPLVDLDRPADGPETAVSLPHSMAVPGAGRFGGGLYRMDFVHSPEDRSPEGDTPWSVLVSRYSGRILVRLNDVLLYDSEWRHSGQIVTLIWPAIIPIPAPLLKDGVNTVEIRTVMAFGKKSYLGRIHAGPDGLLRPVYQWHNFLLITLPQLLFAWEIAFGVLLVIVWAARRSELFYIVFAGILFFNSISHLALVLPDSLVLPSVMWLSNLSFSWVTALLIPFALSFSGRRLPPATLLLAVLPFGTTAGFFLLPPEQLQTLIWFIALPIAVILSAIAVAVLVHAAIRHHNDAAHVILGATLLAVLTLLHQAASLYGATGEPLFISPFSIPVLMVLSVTSTVLMWRFATALNAVDQFNAKLRREIADAEAALRVSLTREQAQERAIALEAERSRLTRDLHDGLAGQLVSMVALSGRTGADARDLGSAARQALIDLRLVIASMAEVGDDPGMMLANFRDHIEPQLRALGITLDWRMHALPEASGWSSSTALELFRLLQEATINAARHSGADRVTIEILPTEDGVRVVVADDGSGGAADRPGGYGLANMRRRAQAIGARLAIDTQADGTSVVVDLPRRTGPAAERQMT
ncbi:Two-component system sensor histidine kinase [Azospirillum argentinense]|uniref:sensor histidine kinase n=1 Tax=Azospirillum argentinense TaxID=2970906 RepID=UPI0032DFF530